MNPVIDNINQCRICLSFSKLAIPINEQIDHQFIYICINKIASVKVSLQDGFPQNICLQCFSHLQAAVTFRAQIVRSDAALRGNDQMHVIKTEVEQLSAAEIEPEPLIADLEDVVEYLEEAVAEQNATQETIRGRRTKPARLKADEEYEDYQVLETDSSYSEQPKRRRKNKIIKTTRVQTLKKKYQKRIFVQTKCCICSHQCKTDSELGMHINQFHPHGAFDENTLPKPTKKQKYECKYCHRRYSRKHYLLLHVDDPNFVEPKQELNKTTGEHTHEPKVCPTCGRVFSDKYQLQLHEHRLHATEKPFQCAAPGCNLTFALLRLAKRHYKNVHEEKKMICDFCAKLFRTMKDLRQHMFVHMENKPIMCPECPKTFTLERVMRAHMIANHSGIEKPFQCDQCEKAYKWKEDLRAHRMVEHLGIYPFKCRYCGKGYSGSSNKNWHEKRCTSNPLKMATDLATVEYTHPV